MKLSAEFLTDQQAEVEGVWVTYDKGVEFKIARDGNSRYQAILRKLSAPLQHKLRTRTVPAEQAEDLVTRAMSEGILRDWRGIENDDGSPLAYTAEEGYKAMTMLPDLRRWIAAQAEDMNLYRAAQQKEDAEALGNG